MDKKDKKPESLPDREWSRFLNDTAESSMEWQIITPEQALKWLETNGKNRSISGNTVGFYADQIRAGDWLLTGQPVIFGRNGKLMDGQHRLAAIVQAERAAPLLVVRGVPNDSFKAIDRGRPRSIGDIFHMAGETNAITLACACRYLASFNQNGHFGKAWGRVSFAKVDGVLKKNPGLRASAHFASANVHSFPMGSPSLLTTLHYLLAEAAAEDAAYFFNGLFTGADLSAGHPILQLRNLILKNRTAQSRYPIDTIGRYVLKAWKMFAAGERGSLRMVDNEDLTVVAVPSVPLAQRYK